MNQMQNYQLNQWEMTDLIKMEDFNGDNSKVDAALKTLAGQVAGKANSATVSSLSTKVNTKAAQSDLTAAVNRVTALESGKADKTALESEIAAREAAVSALEAKAGTQFIRTVTMAEEKTRISVALGDINWADWREVHFIFQEPEGGSTLCNIAFAGNSSLSVDAYLGARWHLTVSPCYTPTLPLGGSIVPYVRSYGAFFADETFQDVTSLEINAKEGYFPAGTSVSIWGVK